MGYLDEQGGSDRGRKIDGQSLYNDQEVQLDQSQSKKGTGSQGLLDEQPKQVLAKKERTGILERVRKGLFGDKTLGEKAKEGYKEGKMAVATGSVGGFENGLGNVVKKLANPKALAGLVLGTGMGVFSIASMFSTYKNDDVIRNDPPLQCESGTLELPSAGGSGEDQDTQATVNILYDIFVNQFGYTQEDLVGMVACMLVETGCNPDRLESDFVLISEKEVFDYVAGPGTVPSAETAKDAYRNYGDAYSSAGMNVNSGYMVDGMVCPGIGLIQWTAQRAYDLIEGLSKVSLDVSPMDVHYQAAFLIAEAQTKYPEWAPGGARTGNSSAEEATKMFFGTMVYGHMPSDGDGELAKRLAQVPAARSYVWSAAANNEFTMDTVTMAEELAEEGFNSAVATAQTVQICVNSSYIITSDIANAAVSISWLERGDYEDVNGAYGSYRRDARSPIMVNDWNFIEGKNNDVNTLGQPYNGDQTYADVRPGSSDTKKTWKFYSIDGAPGKLDLIACTEYYYFAHMIAFPKETGAGGNAGYFSSCDRGTATAVRIAGADDKFPAGNPLYQLAWAIGAKKQGAYHNENARVAGQEAGALWKFSGFFRGSDWYSASGSASVPVGGVMISWGNKAANGLLGENTGGATPDGMLGADDEPEDDDPEGDVGWASKAIQWACLRYPASVTNTTRHIITYVGDSTVQGFWGLDWLYQQWQNFDDADRLIRKDLTETVPEIMSAGLSYKAKYAKDSGDQHMTFYKAKARGAQDHGDEKEFAPLNGRLVEFNSKTGLPEFRAWEQIYVRLIHNSDDDAALSSGSGNQLYERAQPFGQLLDGPEDKGDGYLDTKEENDIDSKIEQYDGEDTYGNKYFYEDWNSLGLPGSTDDVVGDHKNDYKDPGADLIWKDGTSPSSVPNWTYVSGSASTSEYWRYELVTDIEYRTNQFLRFGMASMMCSYPSEEDANVYQTGGEGNDTGHILGNLYRRFSRIPDKVDNSGRYYYYNTVVSNDMLQDLVQLYVEEKNTYTEGGKYKLGDSKYGKNERNFGPMYLLNLRSVYSNFITTSASSSWVDRRYGLTAYDIAYIAGGIEGNKMGEADANEMEDIFTSIVLDPMHVLKNSYWLALYDNTKNSNTTIFRGAHEGSHTYNKDAEAPYMTEIYGMNPFLMLESEDFLDVDAVADKLIWEAGKKTDKSVRNSIEGISGATSDGAGTTAKGIDPTSTNSTMDARLAWIDRHYYVTGNGTVGTFAYQVAGLNPSTGSKVKQADYEDALKSVKTLNAKPNGISSENADTLYSAWKLISYTDYIYAETKKDNEYMAKRLFEKDDRNKDPDGVRDDYNRRDFILIPYYHTHAQQCEHNALLDSGYDHYDLLCRWQMNDIENKNGPNLTGQNVGSLIDTQVALNGQDGTDYQIDRVTGTCSHKYGDTYDYGDTISFNVNYTYNREKYNLEQLLAAMSTGKVRFFADTGDEIAWNAKPYIHVTCDGVKIDPCCSGNNCTLCYYEHKADEDCPDRECQSKHNKGDKKCGKTDGANDCGETECTTHAGTDDDPHESSCHTHDDSCKHNCTDDCYEWEYCNPKLQCNQLKCPGHNPCADGSCDGDKCEHCPKVCPLSTCDAEIGCGEDHRHSCAECLAANYCHPHKECDDYGSWEHGDKVHEASCTPEGWHGDGGNIGGSGFQSDKCHYEYGCNALEFLYHNLGECKDNDGERKHYRLKNGDLTPQTQYDPETMELYEVKAIYMAIVVSENGNIDQFDINNWMTDKTIHTSNAVVCDKANLLQQVTYDGNGWVTRNWQSMILKSQTASLLNPQFTGRYVTDSKYGNSSFTIGELTHASAITVGCESKDNATKGLLQYYTIEGNSIHRTANWAGYMGERSGKYPTLQCEYEEYSQFNGTKDDLMALESIRNKVGLGKNVTNQTISRYETKTVTQTNGPGDWGSSAGTIQYENDWKTEAADASSVDTGNGTGLGNHGWGEVAVVGTQHPKSASDAKKDYGNYDSRLGGIAGVAGPDGSKGNKQLEFGNSLLREIIGDEHVVHVKFDVQDYDGLVAQDAGDNGRDFVYYVDKKRAAKELGVEEGDLKPKDYQSETSSYYTSHLNDFKNISPTNGGSNKYGTFKKMDMDTLYINYYTGELTDKMYAKNVYPHEATDYKYPTDKEHPKGNTDMPPNMKNPPALPVKSLNDGATNGDDAISGSTPRTLLTYKEAESPNGTKTLNTGDYRNWVTHASRGNRGMMTQYLNFGSFFKDVYKEGDAANQDKNNAYMVFEVVMRTDILKNEAGGTDKYGYQMGSNNADKTYDRGPDPITKDEGFVYWNFSRNQPSPPSDATNLDPRISWGYGENAGFSDTYGQGSNSHWKNMMDLYNAAMSETRQYGY